MSELKVKVGSLGAGVQSSTMIYLCNDGLIDPPDFWIFADTIVEPESVYKWLEHLKSIAKQPIIITSKGNIVEDTLSGNRFASIPFFIKKSDEFYKNELRKWEREIQDLCAEHGIKPSMAKKIHRNKPRQIVMGKRQCTYEYKISQIYKCVREQLGYKPKQRMKHEVEMLIGISTDEIQRVKESRVKWCKNVYPLIDLGMSRKDCYQYFDDRSQQRPPRSACYICPFKRDDEWVYDRENNPVEFQKAVEFDLKIRTLDKFKHANFLHKSCKPLGEVDFNPKKKDDREGFINECEGMCGI